MNTNLTGSGWFSKFFAALCLDAINLSIGRVKSIEVNMRILSFEILKRFESLIYHVLANKTLMMLSYERACVTGRKKSIHFQTLLWKTCVKIVTYALQCFRSCGPNIYFCILPVLHCSRVPGTNEVWH